MSDRRALGLAISVAIVMASCSSTATTGSSDGQLHRTVNRYTQQVRLSDLRLSEVVAAPSQGWIYARVGHRGGLFQYRDDGSVLEVAELPAYDSVVATFASGHIYVGGTRCTDGTDRMREANSLCPSWLAEVNRFEAPGMLGGTSVIERVNSPPEDSDGISLLGVHDGVVQIGTDHGVRGVRPNGAVVTVSSTIRSPTTSRPTTPDPLIPLTMSSTGRWYALADDGTLAPVDPSVSGHRLTFPARKPNTVPPAVLVDDSGGAFFACVIQSTASGLDGNAGVTTTQCQFSQT